MNTKAICHFLVATEYRFYTLKFTLITYLIFLAEFSTRIKPPNLSVNLLPRFICFSCTCITLAFLIDFQAFVSMSNFPIFFKPKLVLQQHQLHLCPSFYIHYVRLYNHLNRLYRFHHRYKQQPNSKHTQKNYVLN